MEQNLEALASDPDTTPEELQRICRDHPSLRPLVAMNPTAYPELLAWMANLGDPAVDLALQQRRAAQQVANGPQRVSVIQRGSQPQANLTANQPYEAPSQQSVAAPAWAPVGATAVAADALPQPAPESNRRPGMIAIWILGAVIVVLAAVLLVKALTGGGDGEPLADQPSSAATAPQSEAVSSTEPEDQTAEEEGSGETEETVRFPPPPTALEVDRIVSPSGNITCVLDDQGAQCSIASFSFQDPAVEMCQAQPVTLTTGIGLPTVGCTTEPVSPTGATTLSYGGYATSERGVCESRETGMTCWNTVTGSAFAVAREGFILGDQGPMATGSFPWE